MMPVAELTVLASRSSVQIEAVIDTGFNGDLCLPTEIALQICLELLNQETVELADGARSARLVFLGGVRFLDKEQPIEIYLTDSKTPLIGTRLLDDCRVTIDFPKGTTRITRTKRRS